MGFIKQLLKITMADGAEFTTEYGRDFNGSFDMDEICGVLNFSLPYDNIESAEGHIISFKNLTRFDLIQLFFKEFDTDPGIVGVDDLTMVFDGYIDKIKLSKSKMDYPYTIECLGVLGLANERGVSLYNEEFGGVEAVHLLLQRAGMQKNSVGEGVDIIPKNKVISNMQLGTTELLIKWDGGKLLKEILDNVRDKYGVRVHYQGNGYLHVFEPMAFFSTTVAVDVVLWEFILEDNVISVDYGELTTKYNTVIVHYGPPGDEQVAIAVDPTSLQKNVGSGDNVERINNYSIFHIFRGDILSYDEAVKVAKNKLLELIRNYVVNLTIPFHPEYKVTDFINFSDGEKYQQAFFMIKKYSFTISKTDVSCTIQCVASTLDALPENFIISPLGITDIHTLEIEKDVTDETGWNVFNV